MDAAGRSSGKEWENLCGKSSFRMKIQSRGMFFEKRVYIIPSSVFGGIF